MTECGVKHRVDQPAGGIRHRSHALAWCGEGQGRRICFRTRSELTRGGKFHVPHRVQ